MKSAVIVQARLGSKRFPNKVLADLNGKPVLWHVLTRARKIQADYFVLAAPDVELRELGEDCGWQFFLGPEDDVLERYWLAASWAKADTIIRITGDCPLIDPDRCNVILDEFKRTQPGYLSNVWPVRTVPSGLDCEVFSFEMLESANKRAWQSYDREHVTPWMQAEMNSQFRWDGKKCSVDTPDDLERVRGLMPMRYEPIG